MEFVLQKKVCSPAKVNLHLAVGEKRADGFHDIESIFVPVSLCDRIDLSVSRSAAFSVTIRGVRGGVHESGPFRKDGGFPAAPPEGLALEQNLMYRAALLFHQQTGIAFSLRIVIEKNIPLGAGLGGGSSNAAAVLGALNEAFPLPHDTLMETAARLGSDVPFFVEGKPAFVTGRGEQVAPFDLPRDLFFVLVKPAFASDTPEAYRLLDERRSRDPHGTLPQEPVTPQALIAALEKPPSEWPYRNDFQSVFLDDLHPHSGAYRAIFSALQETGAQFTLLSGSGSTVFGVYESAEAAEAAARAVEGAAGPFLRSRLDEEARRSADKGSCPCGQRPFVVTLSWCGVR